MNNPKISIVILNYKQKGLIKYSLKSLQSLDIALAHEIIVVDNNSADGLEEMIKNEFMRVKFIQSGENKGFAFGNNFGIKAASGDYVLILNPDVRLEQGTIEKLYQFMEDHSKAGVAGPKIFNPDGSLQYTCLRFPDWRLPFFRRTVLGKTKAGLKWTDNYFMTDWDHQENKEVDWLFGACLMIRKKAISEVGLLDERYFLYMEDLDWCRRFNQAGWQIWYVVGAKAIHFHHRQSAETGGIFSLFSKSARIHFTSWLKYFFKFRKKGFTVRQTL